MSEKYYPTHKRMDLYGYWYRYRDMSAGRANRVWRLIVFPSLGLARHAHRLGKYALECTAVFCICRRLSVPRAHMLRKAKI